MLTKIDGWIKDNPYLTKLIVAVFSSVIGWHTHRAVVPSPAPVSVPHVVK